MSDLSTATFGSGCFWCTEAVFKDLKGVLAVVPGYSGGTAETADYETVCTKTTDHAEVVQIEYNELVISFETLLDVFFHTHNPTTLNQQGNDVGPQYRSVIFYHSDQQKSLAQKQILKLNASGEYADKIVTQVVPFETFYPAEDYHQDYFAKNPSQGYCAFVVGPKVAKFRKLYQKLLKD